MDYKVVWSQRASVELKEIHLYYLLHAGANVAQRRIQIILEDVSRLASMPNIGREDVDYVHAPSYRYLVVLDYRIYYYVQGDTVRIAAIWDCRQGSEVFRKENTAY